MPDFFSTILGFVAQMRGGQAAHGGGGMPPGLLEQLQLMQPGVSGAQKQQLIDATTIVCAHSGADEAQCGICLQSLDQGAQLRMAQYV